MIEDKLRKLYATDPNPWMPHPLRIAAMQAFHELTGRNTVLVLATEDDCLIGIRNGSPLVVGYAADEVYIASAVGGVSRRASCVFRCHKR